MITRTGLLVTTAVGALAIAAGWTSHAVAADQLAAKAPVAAAETGWWTSGIVEVGGRFFLKDRGGLTGGNYLNPPPFESLGKFYEYRDLRPGPFGEIILSAGSRDGLYNVDFWAKNIGYDDQSYFLDFSQAGVRYLTIGFDQTPHIYNDNATTIFQGAGSTVLTIPLGVRTDLTNFIAASNFAGIAGTVQRNLNPFELGFQRYTGSAAYRWTPDSAWDVNVDYNYTRRDGTQPMGALTYRGVERGGRLVVELPKPIDDETHNANMGVEYAGVTPWGKRFNITAGYGFSAYRDNANSFYFQNPFAITNNPAAPTYTPLDNVMSLPPDNTANMLRLTAAVDLPWQSRYVGTVHYTMARQDEGFLPFAATPGLVGVYRFQTGPIDYNLGVPPAIIGSSKLGNDNLLLNNVLTTQWTPELKQTTRYRYYDFDSTHSPIEITYFLLGDSANAMEPTGGTARGLAYTKQNASTDFVWRPAMARWLTVGAGVGWERWDRDHRDVNVTDEYMGKVFVDAKPWEWVGLRTSYLHGDRRYDRYVATVPGNTPSGNPMIPTITSQGYPNYRLFDMADRRRDKLNVSVDLYALNGIVITPTGGFRRDDYTHDPLGPNLLGLLRDDSWNAGVEVAWRLTPQISLIGAYIHEEARRDLMAGRAAAAAAPGSLATGFPGEMNDMIDTLMLGANITVIPDKFDVKLAYTYTHSTASITGGTLGNAVWPDTGTAFNRFDVQGKYKLDPGMTRQLGWTGETYVKLRYLWERNEVSDFAAVNWNYFHLFNNYNNATARQSIFLGWNNPNYDVHVLMASVGFKW